MAAGASLHKGIQEAASTDALRKDTGLFVEPPGGSSLGSGMNWAGVWVLDF